MDDCHGGGGQTGTDTRQGWLLRVACDSDADACARLAVVAWQRVHDAFATILGPELHESAFHGWQDAKATAVCTAIRDRPTQALVATVDGRVVGFVTFDCDTARKIGAILNNAVDPAWQGRGIATAMYRAALERMRAAGMRVACVTTGLDDGHAPARIAYERVGFHCGLPNVTYYQELGSTQSA